MGKYAVLYTYLHGFRVSGLLDLIAGELTGGNDVCTWFSGRLYGSRQKLGEACMGKV